jgi:hypothetical protein
VTFPVKVYSMVRFSVTPEVNAASTILIVLTVILTAVALKLQGDPAGVAGGMGTSHEPHQNFDCPRESGDPSRAGGKLPERNSHSAWIPAFAGMIGNKGTRG